MGSLYGFGRQDMRCDRLQDGAGGTARIGIHAKTLTEILLEGQVHIDRSFVNELVWIFLLRGFTRTLSLDSRTL